MPMHRPNPPDRQLPTAGAIGRAGGLPLHKPDPFAGLEPVDIAGWDAQPVPAAWRELAGDARQRIAQFAHDSAAAGRRIAAFVTSDAVLNRQVLSLVAARGLAPGRRFGEWGSGFGLATCAAASLGFDATGIEIAPDLVQAARRLAEDHGIAARYVLGSYQPPGTVTGDVAPDQLAAALGFSPLDFDLVFVFPWPAEERLAAWLFKRFARPGTLLLVYRGGLQFTLWRQPGHGSATLPRDRATP